MIAGGLAPPVGVDDYDHIRLGQMIAVELYCIGDISVPGYLARGEDRIESLRIKVMEAHRMAEALDLLSNGRGDGVIEAPGPGMREHEQCVHEYSPFYTACN
jgi:hypothetical protein